MHGTGLTAPVDLDTKVVERHTEQVMATGDVEAASRSKHETKTYYDIILSLWLFEDR